MATCRGYPTPPIDGDVIDPHSALSQQLFNIAIRESITEVPAHCQNDHLPGEPEAGERRWRREDRTNTAAAAHELQHARTTSSLYATVPVDAYIAQFTEERDEDSRRLVVRNGYHQPREVLVAVTAPRVNDRRTDPDTGARRRFASVILPAWCWRSPKVTEVLPLLYLHGLSTSDFVPALGQFLGSAAGLSSSVITRLTESWKAEQRAFAQRDLSGVDYVYLWADGIHVNILWVPNRSSMSCHVGIFVDQPTEQVAVSQVQG
jgi:Transposase, Mutator family